jgi:hypothetical protein
MSWTTGVRGARAAVERAGTAAVFTGPVIAEIVTDIEGIGALARDYERLYQVTGNTLPFATQEWHLAWCEHLLNLSPRARQEPLFCVLRNVQGACVAIVPLILTGGSSVRCGLLRSDSWAPIRRSPRSAIR